MTKSILLFFITLSSYLGLLGQLTNLEEQTKPFDLDRNPYSIDLMMQGEGGYMFQSIYREMAAFIPKKTEISTIGNASLLSEEAIFPKEYLNRGGEAPNHIISWFPKQDGQSVMYYQDVTLGKNVFSVWAQEYSFVNGLGNKYQLGDSYADGSARDFVLASDSSGFLQIGEPEGSEKDNKNLAYILTNEKYEVKAKGEVALDYAIGKEAIFVDAALYKQDIAIIVYKIKQKKMPLRRVVYLIDFTTSEPSVTKLESEFDWENIRTIGVNFKMDGNTLYLIDFIAQELFEPYGILKYQINLETKEKVSETYLPIPQDVIFQFHKEKERKNQEYRKKPMGITGLQCEEIIILQDGSMHIVASAYTRFMDCERSPCQFYNYYNDMAVFHVGTSGELEWTARVPRRIMEVGYGSLMPTLISQHIYFDGFDIFLLYNDHPENIAQTERDLLSLADESKEMSLCLARIDESGQVTREIVIDNRNVADEDFMLMQPERIYPISDSPGSFLAFVYVNSTSTSYFLNKLVSFRLGE